MNQWMKRACIVLAALCTGGLSACGGEADSEPTQAPASTETAEWYVTQDGVRYGPFTEAELRQDYADGVIASNDVIWREGMDDWAPAHRVLDITTMSGVDKNDPEVRAFMALCEGGERITDSEKEIVYSYLDDEHADPHNEKIERILSHHESVLDQARNGMRNVIDFNLDYSQQPLYLTHLAPMHGLAGMLAADAKRQMALGDQQRAVQDCAAMGRLARQAMQDKLTISSLLSLAIIDKCVDRIEELDGTAGQVAEFREICIWMSDAKSFELASVFANERQYGITPEVAEHEYLEANHGVILQRLRNAISRFDQ